MSFCCVCCGHVSEGELLGAVVPEACCVPEAQGSLPQRLHTTRPGCLAMNGET